MKICLFLLTLFFAACSAKVDYVRLPDFTQKEFSIVSRNDENRLFVSNKNGVYRFVLLNALGAPIADKELRDGEFKSLKFLPPNSEQNELFLGILEILKANANTAKVKTSKNIYEVSRVS